MEVDTVHLRHCLLYEFHQGKNAAEAHRTICVTYGERVIEESTCRKWFRKFKNKDFDLNDKQRSGRPPKISDTDLQDLLDQDSTQTQQQLAKSLGVTQQAISERLHALGKIQKEGKWVPHALTEEQRERRSDTCLSLLSRQKKKSFLWKLVTGDEKWIYFDNPKRRKHWVDPGQPTTSTPKRNAFGKKMLLCIWWDELGVLYYELLQPGETVTGERYALQLNRLAEKIQKERPYSGHGRRPVILQHDNAKPHRSSIVFKTINELQWEILPHPAYSPDVAPSDYHLFRSFQNSLAEQKLHNEDDVRKVVDKFIASKNQAFFRRGIHQLPERWQRVVEANGDYID